MNKPWMVSRTRETIARARALETKPAAPPKAVAAEVKVLPVPAEKK